MSLTNVEEMVQAILPVMSDDGRLLGTVALDAVTTFQGDEVICTVQDVAVPVKHYAMMRMTDCMAIHFMIIPMDITQERVGMHKHLPDFGAISENTPLQGWMSPRTSPVSPSYRNSTWADFLHSRPVQDASVLVVTEVIRVVQPV